MQVGQPAQHALAACHFAHILRIQAQCAVDHGAEHALGDLPADRDAIVVELAAHHGEGLPEFAPRQRAIRDGEFAIQHAHIAAGRFRALEQPAICFAKAIQPAAADLHGDFDKAAIWQDVRIARQFRIIHVKHGCFLSAQAMGVVLILWSRAARSAGSVSSSRPERSFAGRPKLLPARQTNRRSLPRSGSWRQASPSR